MTRTARWEFLIAILCGIVAVLVYLIGVHYAVILLHENTKAPGAS